MRYVTLNKLENCNKFKMIIAILYFFINNTKMFLKYLFLDCTIRLLHLQYYYYY